MIKLIEEKDRSEGIVENNSSTAMFVGGFTSNQYALMQRVAEEMSAASYVLPGHLVGNIKNCFAICMQAARWKMDPFVVASKTYIIGGRMAYESQLIAAVALGSGEIQGRFKYEYNGEWEASNSKEIIQENGKRRMVPCSSPKIGLIRCGAKFKGEEEVEWGEWVDCSRVMVKNSPLWYDNPKQQAAYYATRAFCRLKMPQLLMGIYTPDELRTLTPEKIDINNMSRVQEKIRVRVKNNQIIQGE